MLYTPVDAHSFLSNDIVAKLEQAEKALEFDLSFDTEVNALKRVQPLTISIADIEISVGAAWIPIKYYQQFCKDMFHVDATFYYSHASSSWEVKVHKGIDSEANTSIYGYRYVGKDQETKTIPAVGATIEEGLFTMSMHFKVPKLHDKVAQREATVKQDQLRQLWSEWCKEDGQRALELERLYNRQFNRLVLPNWDNTAPSGFRDILRASGMSEAWVQKLRPYQLDSIWRMAIGGNSLLGLEVGLGKTAVAIAVVMLRKFYRTSNKAMIIVQKSTLSQFHSTFSQMYPDAKVLCTTPEECAGINRQRFIAKAALWDYDAIIITHESFKAIPVRKETELEFIQRRLSVIEIELLGFYMMGESSQRKGNKRGNRLVKKLEEMHDKLTMQMQDALGRYDVGIHFEDISPSMLVVDECQRYKNNFFQTKMKAKGINLSESQRAQDFDLKLSHMRKIYPKDNFLLMITGTPEPTNSMTGVYIFQSYLQPGELKKRGLTHFDAWARAFGRVVTKIEPGISGELQTADRFAEFVNVPELLQMYLSVCHIKRFDDVAGQAGFTRPEHKTEEILIPLSEFQRQHMEYLAYRRRCIVEDKPLKFYSRDADDCLLAPDTEEEKGKKKKGIRLYHPTTKAPITDPAEAMALGLEIGCKIDNHLWVMTDARKLMVAPQLIDPEEPFHPEDKINTAIRLIHEWWEKTKVQRSAQLVFLDWGTPGGTSKVCLYKYIKDELVQRGIPKAEIAFIQNYSDDTKKQWLFDRVNAGDVRVLIGSTEPMGIGVNVQQKVKVMHFVDIPRRPDQYEQRWGRGVRSGNENDDVIIYQYITQGQKGNFGADAAQMNLLETKLKSREQILKGDPTVRRIVEEDDELLSFMMFTAHATGDVRFKRYMECKSELEIVESKASLLLREINRLNIGNTPDSVSSIKESMRYVEKNLDTCQADAELARQQLPHITSAERFACTVEGVLYVGKETPNGIPEVDGEYGPVFQYTTIKAQKRVDKQLQAVVETIIERTRQSTRKVIDPTPIGEYGGFPIMCRVWVDSDGESVDIWLKGQIRYEFKYRVSQLRLIHNLVECYGKISEQDSFYQRRLVELKTQLEQALDRLTAKRREREQVNSQLLQLKQEKAYLEDALCIGQVEV